MEMRKKPCVSPVNTAFNTMSNTLKQTRKKPANPFSLQVSRSRANIAVFNSTTGKQGNCELNIYLGSTSGGLLTSDAGLSKSRNNKTKVHDTESAYSDSQLSKGFSFAKMKARDDSMYRVSDVSYIRRQHTANADKRLLLIKWLNNKQKLFIFDKINWIIIRQFPS